MILEELHPQAVRIAALLRARRETLAIADGASGGLLAASMLSVPGAMEFFVGGGVVYSLRARDVLFAQPRAAYRGMRGASADYALLQARAIAQNFEADWGLAESGSVGGSAHPSGAPAGQSCAALARREEAAGGGLDGGLGGDLGGGSGGDLGGGLESGPGPDGAPDSSPDGVLHGTLHGGGFTRIIETGSAERIANMYAFTRNALDLLEEVLARQA